MLIRWCWPPESWWGRRPALVGQADRVEEFHGPVLGGAGLAAVDLSHDLELFRGCEGGQQVGCLEDDADLVAAQVGEFAVALAGGGGAVDGDGAGVGRDEGGGDSQEAGLAELEGPTTAVRLPLGTSRLTLSRAVRRVSPSG